MALPSSQLSLRPRLTFCFRSSEKYSLTFDDSNERLSFCRIRNSNIAADSFIIFAIIYAICKKIIVVPIIEFYGGLRIYISDLIFGMSLVNYHQR